MKWLICFLCVLSSLTCLSNEKLSLEECINLIEAGRGAEAQKSLQVLFSEQAEAELWNEDRFATAFMLLSNVYSSEGQLRKVSDLCSEALKVFNQKSKVANTEFSRQLWRLSGAVQVELKDYDNAIRYLQQSQWMYEDESIYDMGYFTVLTLLGGCYLQKSDFVTAKLYIDEAEEVHNTYLGKITDSKFIDSYSLLNYKGLLLQALGKSSSAENCFKSVITSRPDDIILESIKDIARNNLAVLYSITGRYDEAIMTFNSMTTTTPALQYSKAQNIAMNSLIKSDFDAAIDFMASYNLAGFSYLQSIIFDFAEVERERYWSEISDQMMRTNNLLALWTNKDKARLMGFQINSFVRDFNLNFQQIIKKQYLSRELPKRRKVWDEYQLNRGRLSYGFESVEQHDSIALAVIETERRILSETGFEIQDFFQDNYDIQKVSSQLSGDEVVIDFIYSSILKGDSITDGFEEGFSIYSLSKGDSVPLLTDVCKQRDLASLVYNRDADEVFINNVYTENSDSIYRLLIEPMLPIINGKRKIYLRPIGYLSSINIEAISMPDGRRFGEAYEVEVVSDVFNLSKHKSIEFPDIALFGDPDFFNRQSPATGDFAMHISPNGEYNLMISENRGNWGLLPWTKTEVENVSNLASSRNIQNVIFIGKEASETAIKELSGKSPSILHFATHGYFIASNESARQNNFLQQTTGYSWGNHLMLYSGLLFSGANDVWNGKAKPNPVDDGVLTSDEISRLDFGNTNLVVLSACDTGRGHQNGTDGVMGLQRAFRAAGAKTMVTSLWKVPDEATALLMQQFYTYLFSKHSVRDSLRLAQEDLRSAGYHDPYYWAAFVVID